MTQLRGARGLGRTNTIALVVRPYRLRIGLLAAWAALAALLEVLVLAAIAAAGAAIAEGRQTTSIPVLDLPGEPTVAAVTIVGLALLAALCAVRLLATYETADLARRALEDTRIELLRHYLSGPWERLAMEHAGDLQTLVIANSTRLAQAVQAVTEGLVASVALVVLTATAAITSPSATVALGAVAAVASLLVRPINRASSRAGSRLNKGNLDLGRLLTQLQANILEIRGLGVERPVHDEISNAVRAIGGPFAAQIRHNVIVGVLSQYLVLLLLLIGLLAASHGFAPSPATAAIAVLLLLRAASFGQRLQAAVQKLSQVAPELEALDAMRHRLDDASRQDVGGQASVHTIERIELRGVDYTHPDGTPVLHGVDLTLRAGRATGIVGPSGAGKTTLLRLLLGLASPSRGEIRVDGVALRDIAMEDWRRIVGFVPQNPQVLSATVADNVRYYRNDIADEDVTQALQRAGLGEWLMDPERRLDGFAGRISGGQLQRVSIARALARRPAVVVFDEPTSALDEASELRIMDTLRQLRDQGTALLIVTHRQPLLGLCDEVLQLRAGRITAVSKDIAITDEERGDESPVAG